MEERKGLIRKLSKYPSIGLILGALGGAYLHFSKGIGLDFSEVQDRALFLEKIYYSLGALGVVTLGGVLYGFLETARRLKDPVIRNYFRSFLMPTLDVAGLLNFNKNESIEEKIRCIEKKREIERYEGLPDLKIGSLYLKKGEIEKGIEYFKNAFKGLSTDDFKGFIEIDKALYSFFARRRIKRRIKKDVFNVENYFDLISTGLVTENFQESVEYWEKLSDLNLKNRVDINILYALFLDALGKHKRKFERKKGYFLGRSSREQWKRTINLILESEDLEKRFRKIADSRNEVLELGPSKFLRDTFVFKRGFNSENLRKGYFVNLSLNELNEICNTGAKLARSLNFSSPVKRFSYDVSERKPLRNLEAVFDEASDEEKEVMLKEALKNQRKIHLLGREGVKFDNGFYIEASNEGRRERIELKRYEIRGNLKRRLADRLGNGCRANEFIDAVYSDARPYLGIFEGLIHGDLAISNLLRDGTALDLETADIGNPAIDPVTTLEDPKNGKVDRKKIFRESYLNNVDGVEREFLEESYDPFSIFISACQVGSKINQGDLERAKGFMRQVLDKGNSKTVDSFVRYIRGSENEKAKELQAAL